MVNKVTGGRQFRQKLKQAADSLKSGKSLKVGFLEGATYPDGTPVALVAAANEFGRMVSGRAGELYYQLPRPFFRGMIAEKSPEWGSSMEYLLQANNLNTDIALDLLGQHIRGQLMNSIIELESPPLADSTVKKKGFEKPLIETGHMMNSVDYSVDGSKK
ncbi:hypothetical protein EOG09_16135 [Salmonella enterica]|nr:hypothetical protein [Salmonella enterica]EBD0803320.1 hypothetical protein [Salmonella enterica]EEA7790248.1 hypothetical protein [Salmonella enterica subsp. enterica serovar Cerro]EKG4721325.1 hypothetical protein [Salmonella enterica subsp. enterica serovar Muenster]